MFDYKKISLFFLILCLVSIAWWIFYLFSIFPKYHFKYQDSKLEQPTIIVLTGGKGRFETGFNLLKNSYQGNMFVSGVHPKINMKKKYLKSKDEEKFFDCCIRYGMQATSTIENVKEVKEWLDIEKKKAYLVTSYYHLPRAKLIFEKEIPNTYFALVPAEPSKNKKRNADNFFEFKVIIQEFFKIMYLIIFGI